MHAANFSLQSLTKCAWGYRAVLCWSIGGSDSVKWTIQFNGQFFLCFRCLCLNGFITFYKAKSGCVKRLMRGSNLDWLTRINFYLWSVTYFYPKLFFTNPPLYKTYYSRYQLRRPLQYQRKYLKNIYSNKVITISDAIWNWKVPKKSGACWDWEKILSICYE